MVSCGNTSRKTVELAVVNDDFKAIDPSSIVLPESAISEATSPQIMEMKKTTAAVKTNFIIAGKCLASSSEQLAHLKGLLPKRTWTKFINSGALPLSSKAAQDLCNAYEFIRDFKLTDGDCIYLSSRSLNRLANANPDVQGEASKRLKAGVKLSESDVKALSEAVSESDLSSDKKTKIKKNLTAAAKLDDKDKEIEKLKADIAKLKAENSKLKSQQTAVVNEVVKKVADGVKLQLFKGAEVEA